MKLVVIESPFKGINSEETRRNVLYARICVKDSLNRGEAPYASHLFYTQTGLTNDLIESERMLGIEAGLAWGEKASLTAVYEDLGISLGMSLGIERAFQSGRQVEYRKILSNSLEKELEKIAQMKHPMDLRGLLF